MTWTGRSQNQGSCRIDKRSAQTIVILEFADKSPLFIVEFIVPTDGDVVFAPVPAPRPAGHQYQGFLEQGLEDNTLADLVLVTHGEIEQPIADLAGCDRRGAAGDADGDIGLGDKHFVGRAAKTAELRDAQKCLQLRLDINYIYRYEQ
jgi:hypothetical protein